MKIMILIVTALEMLGNLIQMQSHFSSGFTDLINELKSLSEMKHDEEISDDRFKATLKKIETLNLEITRLSVNDTTDSK